jgi:phage terminase large subunit-like protein
MSATLQAPPTRSGLLPEARHLILPDRIVSSGFPAVEQVCLEIGIEFDPWERDLNKCLLAKDRLGLYAADTAVLSIARQVGKTFDVGAVAFALCIAIPRLTVVWTAHRFKVSRESFNEMRGWAKRRELVPHIDYDAITTAAGNECIPFRNGSRILFAARERGAVRGFTKVGMLVLDEAQILSEAAMSDLIPTTNQAENPLIILMGTPPKPTDPSEVFTRLRTEALEGESRDVLYVELSADDDANPDDREQWAKANLSYPKRTPARAILRLRKLLAPEDFMREALGVWAGAAASPLPLWPACATDATVPQERPLFFLDASPSLTSASVGVAVVHKDRPHLELADYRGGSAWLVTRAAELRDRYPGTRFAIQASGAVSKMLPALLEVGIEPEQFTDQDMGRASVHLQQLVADEAVTHDGDSLFTQALTVAVPRDIGDNLWTWSRRRSGDISPLVAVTGAAWLLETQPSYDLLESIW